MVVATLAVGEAVSSEFEDCGLNGQARALAALIVTDPMQRRKHIACDPLLARIADAKAREMAELGSVDHIGRSAANRRLVEAGYPLSRIYPRLLENNVEAIAGGISGPGEAWKAFKQSATHRSHLLGEHEFYLLQDEIGVGFIEDASTPHVEYWVVYIAHRGGDGDYRGRIAKSKD